jgi:hypothetical protein
MSLRGVQSVLLAVLGAVLMLATARAADGDITPTQKWTGQFPVNKLETLPRGQQDTGVGYIGDAKTFEAVWKAWKPDEKVPEVDFKENIVVFARNVRFLNAIQIGKVTVKEGVASVLALETRTARPIVDKVYMSAVVIPRKDIKSIQAGAKKIDVAAPEGK